MRIVIDGDNFALIPTPHPKDKPTFILYLFATQLSGETGKEQSSPSLLSGVFCGGGNWMSSAGEQSVDTHSMCSSSNWLESQVSLLWNRVYLHSLLLMTGKLSHGQNCQKREIRKLHTTAGHQRPTTITAKKKFGKFLHSTNYRTFF